MALTTGSKLGAYEIIGPLGRGGMGEVYRARDSKLKREVAIKILPEAFARDPERVSRFQREAEVLAALNHPHIAAIYDLAEAGDSRCLVLELVEGDTLAEVIARGPIPIVEALAIAKQIAEALEAAHEKGIIHRDLKPANVKLTPAGNVKVLDFGLAKVLAPDPADVNFSESPTMASGSMAGGGAILGTAAYMSPEQARGKPADSRSDIWAFGVVLYEMLTGKQAFTGETLVEILGGVMKADSDWAALPATTPPGIRSLLRRCLQKDRGKRLRDIADARFQIEEALTETPAVVPSVVPARKTRGWVWMVAAVVAVLAAVGITASYFKLTSVQPPETRLQINTPPGNSESLAISPDGRTVVYQATTEGKTQLWLRPLDSETAKPLAGTENGFNPFWSPDSRSIGFFAAQKLKRIDIAGGTAQTLADAPSINIYGAAWNADGVILFVPANGPIYRVPARGGQSTEATHLDSPRQTSHRFPHFLPDGFHFLYISTGLPDARGVYVGSLASKDSRRLFDADTAAVFAPPDQVLFVRQDTLFAQRLDLQKLEPVGDPVSVTDHVDQNQGTAGSVSLSASAAGSLVYRTAGTGSRQLIWVDRSGKQIGTVGAPDPAGYGGARLSPDGRTVALERIVSGNRNVWLIDMARGVFRPFTFDATKSASPIWSPDGTRIAFGSFRKGLYDLYEKQVSGAGTETVLLESPETKNISDWSPDGRFILYASTNPKTARDLWALPLDGDRKPFVLAQTSFEEVGGRFSADSRWIAYQSNETGRNEIYVQHFPGPGGKWQVSTNGGTNVEWRRDGREIFYMAPDNRLMAVPVTLPAGSGQPVEAGAAVVLFPMRSGSGYDAAPDGQRFLINTPTEDASTSPITVILNWHSEPGK